MSTPIIPLAAQSVFPVTNLFVISLFSGSISVHLLLRPPPCDRIDWHYHCCHTRMYARIDSAHGKVFSGLDRLQDVSAIHADSVSLS